MSYIESYTSLRARVDALGEERIAKEFAEEFSRKLGTLAALTPRKDWPRAFEIAFQATRIEMPTSAQIYAKRLPK